MFRGLGGTLERHFGCLIPAGLAEDLATELQGVGMGLERERAVEREQCAVPISQLVGGIAEFVPDE